MGGTQNREPLAGVCTWLRFVAKVQWVLPLSATRSTVAERCPHQAGVGVVEPVVKSQPLDQLEQRAVVEVTGVR